MIELFFPSIKYIAELLVRMEQENHQKNLKVLDVIMITSPGDRWGRSLIGCLLYFH